MEIKRVLQVGDAKICEAEHERNEDRQSHEDQEDHCPWQSEKPACKILLLAPGLAGPGRRFKRRLCLWRGQGGTSLAHCPLPLYKFCVFCVRGRARKTHKTCTTTCGRR